MKLRFLAALAALVILVGIPPKRTEAQGLVEYALVLVLVGISADEQLEVLLRPPRNRAGPSRLPPSIPTELVVTIQPGEGSSSPDGPCLQVASFTVDRKGSAPTTPVRIAAVGNDLMVNGAVVELLDDCLSEQGRLVFGLGIPGRRPGHSPQRQQLPRIVHSYAVLGPEGTRSQHATTNDDRFDWVLMDFGTPG